MGNEQSAPAPRGPRNKLSKPRTNSSANTSNSKSSGVASRRNSQSEHIEIPSNRYSTISLDAVVGEAGEKQREPKRKRTSLFRSRSTQPKVQQLDIGSGVNIDYIESPKEGWSRRNSVIEDVGEHRHYSVPVQSTRPPIQTARMSLQHVPYSQHHQRLSLVPEATTPQTDLTRERRQPVQSQRRQSVHTQEDNEPTLAPPLSTRTQSETALYAPIRRRSLLQHGVATRNSWIEKNESIQSLPTPVHSQPELQNYYYNPAKPTSSPLTALANLETPKFDDNVPGPRVATPNDLDYGHIGAYKLGSLRITNGAASPAPSIERPSTTGGEDDRINAGDSRVNALRHRHGLSQRSNTIGVPPEIIKPPWTTQKRAESPLRKEYFEDKVPEPLTIETHLPLPEFSLFNFTDNHTDSPTKSLDLARSYMSDLALSPFSFEDSPPPSPRLEATSKHMAVEDDLFEAEPNTPNTPEVSEFSTHKSFDSGYRGERATPQEEKKLEGPRELAPKPLAKADSGYSSNVSLRSFKENKPPSVPTKDAPPTPPKPVRSTSSTYSEASSLYSTKSDMTVKPKRSLPALPVEDETPAQPYRQPPPVPQKSIVTDSKNATYIPPLPHKSPEQSWAASQPRPNVIVKAKPKHDRSQSIPNVPSVSRLAKEEHKPSHSPAGSEASTSSASSGSTSRWRSRSKSRSQSFLPPSHKPVFTVQAFRTASEQLNIPPISPQASRSLEERVGAFPVACFPNTERGNNPMRRTPSKETLGTIFSVGSAEWREELTYSRLQSKLPAVPPIEPISESPTPGPDSNRRHTYQPLVSSIPARKPIRQSLPSAPRNNPTLQQKLQQDFETQITSFDNISSSLGKSPYDLAISPATEAKRKQQEKAKSMTAQFEAEAAAKFARARTVSEESQSSQRLQRTTSYDSISNQNPWAGSSSAGNSRVPSREYPPQAHGNGGGRAPSMLPPQRSNPNLRAEQCSEDNGHSFASAGSGRIKSPPPVSMQTQRSGHSVVPTSRTPQPQAQPSFSAPAPPPNRTAPQPPAHFSPLIAHESEKEVHDPWAKQRDFWASRKQVALHSKKSMEKIQARKSMENVQSRKSMEVQRRPVASRPSFDNPGPRSESARPSMDVQRRPVASRPSFDNPGPRSESARPSMEYQTAHQYPHELSHHTSFDNSQPWRPQMPRQQSYGCGYRGPSQEWAREGGEGGVKEYDHTYGSYSESEKENPPFTSSYTSQHQQRQQAGEEEYYDGPSQDSEDFPAQSVANNSTSDMLVLDRFAGGLGYGYEPGFGLVGSAGTRNVGKMAGASRKSVNESVNYGLDFSDVPVFLQRVRVEN